MDCYKILVLILVTLIASSKGTVTVTDPSGRNAVTVQGTLTLRCTISPLTAFVIWLSPAAAGGSVCYCTNKADNDCRAASYNDIRASCTSDVSQGLFTLTITNMDISDEGSYACRHNSIDTTLNISIQVPISSVDVTSPSTSPVSVTENSPITVVCETSPGRPQATTSWYKQLGNNPAVHVQGGTITTIPSGTSVVTRSTLQYTPARSDHNYRVYCTAYNIDVISSLTSNNKPQLYVQYAPDKGPVLEGQTGRSTFYILDGKPQSLTCSIDGGRPLPSLRWVCFSGAVQDQSTGTTTQQQVTWTATRAHDRQSCICLASHPVWLNERQVFVNVKALYPPVSPTFTVQSQPVPATVSVIEGNSVSVTCNSTSNPSPVYSWNPSGSSSSNNILTLTSVSVGINDVNQYTCTVSNTMVPTQGDPESGSSSASFSLNVLFPPKPPVLTYNALDGPIINSAFKVVKEDSFSVYCKAEGNPTPSYQWSGQLANTYKLTVSGIQTDTSWTCTTTNTMVPTGAVKETGWSTATATANVLYSAEITEFTINGAKGDNPFIYNESTKVTFVCVVDSNPGSEITISRDGSLIIKVANTTEITHTVNDVSCLDAGMYSCTAMNQYNDKIIPTISHQVYIRCHPRASDVMEPNITVNKALHEPVTLYVSFIAYPIPTCKWFKADSSSSDGWTILSNGISCDKKQTNMTIENLRQADFGQYKVEVKNGRIPDLVQYFVIEAIGPPDMPVGFMLIGSLQMPTFYWKKGNNGGYNQTFVIQLSPEGSNEWTQTLHISEWDEYFRLPNEHYIAEFKGLDSGTYSARIMSTNSFGTSNVSEQVYSFLVTHAWKVSQDNAEQSTESVVAAGVIAGIEAVVIIAFSIAIIYRHVTRKDKGVGKQNETEFDREPRIELKETVNSEGPYTNIGSDVASSEHHADEASNFYEKLDPALKKDGVYEAMETGKDEWKQNKEEEYVNLNV